ncbi:hypothetical protein [Wenzhouxiangella sp. EGI_FJ10409]|uniref:hypothetical protein n=1 Tax=Wenzhouxiangella sp. EGI_FJ10409 TaxID=3243767 RepID=UPI0035D60D4B
MNEPPLRILFAPASGPGGSGEYYRCLTLARAVAARAPSARIDFLLSVKAGVERDERFTYHEIADTPARAGDEVLRLIESLRPQLAVFDCTGRVRQFRALQRAGARVVWISDRSPKRLKGFRPRQLRQVDLHLAVDVSGRPPKLKAYEKLLLAVFGRGRAAAMAVPGIVAEPDREALAAWRERLPEPGRPYAVFVAGGGGYVEDGRPVPEILVDAAERLAEATGIDAVVVLGPQYRGSLREHSHVCLIDSLPTAALGALLADARLAVTGAGSMLSAQVLAAGVPAVMIPAGGNDQAQRIRDLERAGLVAGSPLRAPALAERARALLEAPERAAEQVARQRALGTADATAETAERLLTLARSGRPQRA